MAVILAYGSPALGHLYPLGALLRELASRKHQIHLRTMASEVAAMRSLGIRTEPVDPRIEAIAGQDWLARNALGVLRTTVDVLCRRAVIEVGDLQRAIAAAKPDVIIVDANCWGAMAIAEASNLPWLVFSPFTPYLRSRSAPPFGPGLRPLPGLAGTVRDASMRPFVSFLFDRRIVPRLNAIRADVGVPAVASVDALMRRAPLVLSVGGEPFEYPHPDWDDLVHFIGACEFEPSPVSAPDWIGDIERPIVLVTTSSIAQADAGLGRIALQALAAEPVHVVATFPAGVPRGLMSTPNATVCRFVNHGAVLDRAVCAITHGGMGATVKALNRGVPVCAVPYARDQAEVARRVQVAGCGTRLPARRLTPSRLRAAVLMTTAMADGARRVAAGFAATGGVARGADLIEQRLLLRVLAPRLLPPGC
ncbi:putative glycosyltransferase [Mycobacterium lentiflavum]|uniref:Glycosyltransferase n=1 Tax=Mycobacterium lentiflavum TaxID=141349 RepID=A0A0E3WBV7_MYCLN|nr:glycosyltransferase [Mycobacterium lentiflavum]MEE3062810.1 glycosyltransferase [Actinomycetota bacterium]ULP43932.1 glycosyltransferase [Mycobacterium lentiflavum]CQD10047.1 putative glycosyltransferase [Mycobacterium lentiflavum]